MAVAAARLCAIVMNSAKTFTAISGLFLIVGCGSSAASPGGSAIGGPAGAGGVSGMSGGGQAGATAGATQQTGGSAGASAGASGASGLGGAAQGGAAQGGSAQGGAAGSSNGGSGGTGEPAPLEECMGTPSVDRLTSWSATSEGVMVPASGSILVMDGADYVGKVQFVGSTDWHVLPVLIANKFDVTADLSASSGFWLTYSATADLHVQLRTKSHWSGGAQYAADVPGTAGAKQTKFISFAPAGWASLFDPPALSFADSLKEAMGLVFVGNKEATIVFYGLRIDGYTPMCP